MVGRAVELALFSEGQTQSLLRLLRVLRSAYNECGLPPLALLLLEAFCSILYGQSRLFFSLLDR